VGDTKIKVFVLKAEGINNSASGNRHEMILKMVKRSFNTIVIEKQFFIKESPIKKFLYGLRFRFQLGMSAFHIPTSNSNHKNVILLFTIDALTALIVKLISGFKRNKVIIERNEYPAALRGNDLIRGFFYKYFILSWQYKLYDGLFLMTDELINFYKKYTKKKCIIKKLPMTVDFSRFNNKGNRDSRDKYIAYTGSLSNEKDGIVYLLNAFVKISKKVPGVKLKIAGGKGYDINKLRGYTEELGIAKRIEFLGMLNRNLIPSFIQNAMVLVLPRPDSLQARGGFPTKLGEYLATSKPVIVTKVGEIASYLDDEDVFFINPDNIEEELVNTLAMVLRNYKNAIRVGIKGQKKALKYFSLDANKGKVADLINNVAGT